PDCDARNGDCLSLPARHEPDRSFERRDLCSQALDFRSEQAPHLCSVEEAEFAEDVLAAELAAEEHIRGGIERARESEVLVDGLDAGVVRVVRALEADALAGELDSACIRLVDAREDLDQGRLACTVVAD